MVFLAALALPACAMTPAQSFAAVHGVVLATPGCPVQRIDSPCPDIRVADATVVARLAGVEQARVLSGADGSFVLALTAGTYSLEVTSPGAYHRSKTGSLAVPVPGGGDVTVTVDSGIR